MADPAIQAAIEAVIAAVEAVIPTIDPSTRFRRKNETAPASTRAGKRLFDFATGGLRDDSNEGRAGSVQNVGKADRTASVTLRIEYPLGRSEKALEMTLAVDAELLLRAIGRSAVWTGTPVRRVSARATVDRTETVILTEAGSTPGQLVLAVAADIQYRDTE